MENIRPFSGEEIYKWLLGQRMGKIQWLADFSAGKKKWPDDIIRQKQNDLAMLNYMVATYERKFAGAQE